MEPGQLLNTNHLLIVCEPGEAVHDGNSPNIAARISAHRKAVYSVLHAGLARSHRANPAAALRVVAVVGCAVLLSGLASQQGGKILD